VFSEVLPISHSRTPTICINIRWLLARC